LLLFAAACGERSAGSPPAQARHDGSVADPPFVCESGWTKVGSGIEYRMLNCSPARRRFDLHLVRVDPRLARIEAVLQPDSSAEAVARQGGWTVALNANFFDESFRPLGVVMSNGKQVNPTHPVSWQSVFYVTRNDRARIAPVPRWKDVSGGARAAVQAGPRIVVAGERNRVARARPSWRSGVCIDGRGRAVLFATPRESLFDVAEMVELAVRAEGAGGMGCRDAMLFDGGPSTQLFVARGERSVSVEGDKHVPAYLAVKSR
jgi:uncharacterized protein YigE (DUF2233 family)